MGLETARAFRVLDGGEEVADYLAAGKAEELAVLDSDLVSSLRQMLSQILEELGCLPDCEEAHRVFEHSRQRKRLFGLLKRKAS
jgi:pilus assembly protein CpaE